MCKYIKRNPGIFFTPYRLGVTIAAEISLANRFSGCCVVAITWKARKNDAGTNYDPCTSFKVIQMNQILLTKLHT